MFIQQIFIEHLLCICYDVKGGMSKIDMEFARLMADTGIKSQSIAL